MKPDELRTPMANTYRLFPFAAVLVLGCASGPTLPPQRQAALVSDERSTADLVNKGRQAAAQGDAVRAEQYLSLAIEQGADRRQVMPLLLDACLKSSHLRAALNHAEPYLREHPEDDTLRYLAANIHVSLGQLVRARRELGLLLQKDPKNPDAHYLLGILDTPSDIEAARNHFFATIEFTQDEDQRIEVKSRVAELRLLERERAGDSADSERALETFGGDR